jgi:hypothetical protein
MAQESSPDYSQLPVSGLVPFVQVHDVERSAAFYALLGFAIGNRQPREGRMQWAWLYTPGAPDWRRGANLMLSRSERAIDPAAQRVLFYVYVSDLPALRARLVEAGQTPGPIEFPEYLPKGEFPIHDPDGYVLMVAQNSDDTP